MLTAQIKTERKSQKPGNRYSPTPAAKFQTRPMNMIPVLGMDPAIVSLTKVELQRLLDIEAAAQNAVQAMSRPRSPDPRELLAAAKALDVALHMPVFGG
jgi:hypothetical protein